MSTKRKYNGGDPRKVTAVITRDDLEAAELLGATPSEVLTRSVRQALIKAGVSQDDASTARADINLSLSVTPDSGDRAAAVAIFMCEPCAAKFRETPNGAKIRLTPVDDSIALLTAPALFAVVTSGSSLVVLADALKWDGGRLHPHVCGCPDAGRGSLVCEHIDRESLCGRTS